MDITVTTSTGGKKRVSRETHSYKLVDCQTVEQAAEWFEEHIAPQLEAQQSLEESEPAPAKSRRGKA